jgi:hypothetical protein
MLSDIRRWRQMMNRVLLGGLAAILMLGGGLFMWQGQSAVPDPVIAPPPPAPEGLPVGAEGLVGRAPPAAPRATTASREERRFQRYDRNRDGTITRVEMLSSRTNAFRRLDRDGNNLLSFEEWAVKTSDRFAAADRDRSGGVSQAELIAATPRRPAQRRANCACDGPSNASGGDSDE